MDAMESIKFSLRDVLHVVFKRKLLAMLFFCGTICVVALVTFLVEPVYETTSQILVKPGREDLYVPTGGNATPVVNLNPREQINSEIEILKSMSLTRKVVESLGPDAIYETDNSKKGAGNLLSGLLSRASIGKPQTSLEKIDGAIQKLQKNLSVTAVKNSKVIEVRFKHNDPVKAATVVNNLVNFYLDFHLDVHKNPKSHMFFQEQAEQLKSKLVKTEENIESFKKQHGITDLKQQQSLLLQQEAQLRTELNQTLSQEVEAKNRIRQLRQQLAVTPETIAQEKEIVENSQWIGTLESRLVELEYKESELLARYTEENRLVQDIRDEIQMVRKKLKEQENKTYDKNTYGLNTTYQRLQENIFNNEAELSALQAKKEIQKTQLDNLRDRLEKLNKIEVELNLLNNEVGLVRQEYQLYKSKFEESRISDEMDSMKIVNVSLIQPARPPLKPVSPKKLLNLVLAVVLGGIGGLIVIFLVEYQDDRLEKVDEVEKLLKLPVLASIPEFKEQS